MRNNLRSRIRIRTRVRTAFRRIWPPKPEPVILVYHRIATETVDPWKLAVSPGNFEEQLHVLRRTRHPLTLNDFVRRFIDGTLPSNAVAVTFDDGYVDNLAAGKPRLASADVPATVFIPTGFLSGARKFWWDELASYILLGNGPSDFEIVVRNQVIRSLIGSDIFSSAGRLPAMKSLELRRQALMTIWQALLPLEEPEREPVMDKIRGLFTVLDYPGLPGPAMSDGQVKELIADGLITIGAHSVTHPMLSAVGLDVCQREIVDSKRTCEELTGAPITSFAYPYGDFDAKSRNEVKVAGFTSAFSMQRTVVRDGSDLLAIPRVYITDVDGDQFAQTLWSITDL